MVAHIAAGTSPASSASAATEEKSARWERVVRPTGRTRGMDRSGREARETLTFQCTSRRHAVYAIAGAQACYATLACSCGASMSMPSPLPIGDPSGRAVKIQMVSVRAA